MTRTLDSAKRTAILAAGKQIFIRDGYANAKMFDIANEAGVASGTLYLYFENKEALAGAIGEEFFSLLFAQFEAIVREIEDPDGVADLVDWALQVGDQERVVLAMSKERNADLKSQQESRQRLVEQLQDALSELTERGVIRRYQDTTTLADMVLAVVRRLLMSYAHFDGKNIEELKSGAVEFLQHALFEDVALAASRLYKRRELRGQ